jgi:chromosome partitioning protein
MSKPAHCRIFSVANQKGGVGKTTTAVNLGTALAAVGKRVLLIDLDAQGNASTGLGVFAEDREFTSYHVLIGEIPLAEAIVPTSVKGMDLCPASEDLSGADLDLADVSRRAHRLADALAAGEVPVQDRYDYILMDCPPSLSIVTINSMVASTGVIVPLQCEFYALEGLSQLIKTVRRVKSTLNPTLEIQGVVLTMYDSRNNLSAQVADDVRAHLGKIVYETKIPRNVRISEAPSHGKPALLYDHSCAGSQAYIHLASELLRREQDALAA